MTSLMQAFTVMDRVNLLIDAFGFVRAGLLNASVALDLSKYLRYENEYGPWKAALDALDYVSTIHIGTPLYEPVQVGWLSKEVVRI